MPDTVALVGFRQQTPTLFREAYGRIEVFEPDDPGHLWVGTGPSLVAAPTLTS